MRETNNFSKYHRTSLPSNFLLWDIDGIYVDDNDNVVYIKESKYKFETKEKGNFLKNFFKPTNLQACYLRYTSEKIPVIIEEERSKRYWEVVNWEMNPSTEPQLRMIDTSNKIYIEEIRENQRSNPKNLFLRMGNDKENKHLEKYADQICDKLGLNKILVNDTLRDNKIFFKKNKQVITTLLEEKNDWTNEWNILDII